MLMWHLLITILTLDFLYRAARYGPREVQQIRSQMDMLYRGKKLKEYYESSVANSLTPTGGWALPYVCGHDTPIFLSEGVSGKYYACPDCRVGWKEDKEGKRHYGLVDGIPIQEFHAVTAMQESRHGFKNESQSKQEKEKSK